MPVLDLDCWRIPAVTSWASVIEIACEMRRYDITALVVVEDGLPLGTVTQDDLINFVILRDSRPRHCLAGAVVRATPDAASATRPIPVLGTDGCVAGVVPYGALVTAWSPGESPAATIVG